ncbi:pirin family protein [Roseospira goensis]|uniref:Pirin family protein n=1 Tax=Roseospira goensis TaxID=391922 RepID=A0A7W6RYL7_9PROT|nr:pirin family protein [Roseospira goensis]MBB4285651.1 hypothetical protein [Roseospira goensis]
MYLHRPADERGHARFGWLDSRHTFSFGHYLDPAHMGFGPLRVINEDRVRPGAGFDTHGHRDMEILSYVLAGALRHEDSLGTGSVIRPGEIQRMTAGTGIRHSEYNASATEPVHFLQIWILPEAAGLAPSYEQIAVPETERRGRLRLLAARDGRDGAVTVHQDVDLYGTLLTHGEAVSLALRPGRIAWVQVARGVVRANTGLRLGPGDGLGLSEAPDVTLTAQGTEDAEVLVFDMAAQAPAR